VNSPVPKIRGAQPSELTTTYPEPGATHFALSDTQVVSGQGAFLIAYLDDVAIGCGAVWRLNEATAEIIRMYGVLLFHCVHGGRLRSNPPGVDGSLQTLTGWRPQTKLEERARRCIRPPSPPPLG
jgi:hypothetical protein